jgi:hypothetical protein
MKNDQGSYIITRHFAAHSSKRCFQNLQGKAFSRQLGDKRTKPLLRHCLDYANTSTGIGRSSVSMKSFCIESSACAPVTLAERVYVAVRNPNFLVVPDRISHARSASSSGSVQYPRPVPAQSACRPAARDVDDNDHVSPRESGNGTSASDRVCSCIEGAYESCTRHGAKRPALHGILVVQRVSLSIYSESFALVWSHVYPHAYVTGSCALRKVLVARG